MIQQKLNIKLFLLLFLVLFGTSINAQTVKETEYNKQKLQLYFQQQKLDSLNNILEEKVIVINVEKSKIPPNKNKIQKLLSGTANLTNLIEKVQVKIDKLNKQLSIVKSKLVMYYDEQIDSIKNSNLSKEEKNIFTIQLTEKKLLVSPKINLLSFEPEKILQTRVPTDTIKQKIYYEYLTSAKLEVENKIRETGKLKIEIENIISLSKKTEEFLDETNFENDILSYSSISERRNKALGTDEKYFDGAEISQNSIVTQTISFTQILNQVNLSNTNQYQTYGLNNLDSYTKLNILEFKELIDQVEKQLIEYKAVIKNKLNKN